MMNRLNPEKLMRSKWTALHPERKQKHYIVIELIRDDDNRVVSCEIEAVINHQKATIDWRLLQDDSCWAMGWE